MANTLTKAGSTESLSCCVGGSRGGGIGCYLPVGGVSVEEELAEVTQVVHSTHFVVQLRVHNQVEVVVDLLNLCEVLVLHAATSLALGAVLRRVGEKDLVDYNVVDVDLLLGQLDGQSLGLVH